MQCKDIPDLPILEFLDSLNCWGTMFDGVPNSVYKAMPNLPSHKLAYAKMAQLIKRGLVDGCSCGCRGDFEITEKGKEFIAKNHATP